MDVKDAIKHMIFSALAFACMNVIVKYLESINSYQIVFFRSLGSLVFSFAYLIKNKIPIVGNKNGLLILRSVFGAASMIFFFISIKYLSVGTAVSLRYISPIFAAIFAVIFLKETIKIPQWFFFAISFIGVLVLKGLDTHLNTTGLIYVLIAAVLSGLVYIMINQIGKSEHPVVVVNYFMFIATVLGAVLSIGNWVTPDKTQWPLLIALGVFGYLGQINMTKALQTTSTNIIAPFIYVEVIFSVILGAIIFNEIYTFWSLLGILLIILGLILNIWYKGRLK